MPTLGDMVVRIVGDNSQFDNAVDKSEKKYAGFQKKLEKTGRNLTKFVTVPIVAAGVAMIKFASDAEETSAKFGTAFRDVRDAADKTAKNLATNYGMSRQESERLLAGTGDLLKGFGASGAEALALSEKVQTLAVDLVSYNNLQGGASRASDILTKAMLGEREALQALGVKVQEQHIKEELLLRGQDKLTGQALLLAKAEATLALVVRQSADAQGDFARTQDSVANMMIRVKSNAINVATSFGKQLLPAVAKVLGKVSSLLKKFDNLSDGTKKFLVIAGGVAATIGPMILIIAKLITAFGVIKTAVISARAAMLAFNTSLLTNPIFLVVSAIAALTIGLLALTKKTRDQKDAQYELLDSFDETTTAVYLTADAYNAAVRAAIATVLMNKTVALNALNSIQTVTPAISRLTNEIAGLQDELELLDAKTALRDTRRTVIGTSNGGTGEDDVPNADAKKELSDGYKQIAEQAKLATLSGEEFSAEEEKRKLVLSVINGLIEDGFTVQGSGIQAILSLYGDILNAEDEQIIKLGWLTARQREIKEEMLEASLVQDEYTRGLNYAAEAIGENIIKTGWLTARQREIAEEMQEATLVQDEYTKGVNYTTEAIEEETVRFNAFNDMATAGMLRVAQVEDDLREEKKKKDKEASDEERALALEDASFKISTISQVVGMIQSLRSAMFASEIAGAEGNAAKIKEIQIEQARSAKNFAIFDIGLKTAQAIIGFLANPGGPAGIALSVIAGVLGLAQIATVASTPLPALADGGVVMPRIGGVPVNVAEAGSPEVIFPLDRLDDILSSMPGSGSAGGGDIRLVVNMDSKPILEKIFPATRNGTILIDARAVV